MVTAKSAAGSVKSTVTEAFVMPGLGPGTAEVTLAALETRVAILVPSVLVVNSMDTGTVTTP